MAEVLLLKEWALRARKEGLDGTFIRQILDGENFEEASVQAVAEAVNGTATRFPTNPDVDQVKEDVVEEAEDALFEQVEDDTSKQIKDDPSEQIKEATTSDLSDFVGNASNIQREMIKAYDLASPVWRKIVKTVTLSDMKAVTRLRRSDTDKYLPVPQGGEVQMSDFSSYKVTYSPKKYERGVNFTWEMLINDDLSAFKNIGRDLAQAAQVTVSDFVMSFISDNAVIYDGKTLFHADHDNVGSDALSEGSLIAAVTSMRQQKSEKGNPLIIQPGYLVVPPELEFSAKKLISSTLVPGGSYNDFNVLKGMVEVIVEPLLTDSNNWYLVAKPSSIDTIEIGFLGGRETPEVMIKDDFERDVVSYKGRIAFGGAVLDYRGFYGSIVS